MWEIIGVSAIYFGAMLINAITGFAGNMLSMPGSIHFIGFVDAKVVSILVGTYNCLILMAISRHEIRVKEVCKMVLMMIPGMLVGLWLFYNADLTFLLYLYGVLIIVLAIRSMLLKRGSYKLHPIVAGLIMTGAGLMQSLFVSGGALVVIYAVCVFRTKEEFRASLSLLWAMLNALLIIQSGIAGEINGENFVFSLIVGAVSMTGIYFGNRLHRKLSGPAFLKLTNTLLVISGLSCFLKG